MSQEIAEQTPAPGDKIAYSIDEVTRITSTGRTAVYEAIKARKLKARKNGRRTIIVDTDLRAWLSSLPEMHSEAA